MEGAFVGWQGWVWIAGILMAAVVVGLLGHYAVFHRAGQEAGTVVKSLIQHSRRPVRVILLSLALLVALSGLPIEPRIIETLRHGVSLGLIASLAWLAAALTEVFEDLIAAKYPLDVKDNLLARQIRTRLRVLRRIGVVSILFVAFTAMLMTFPHIRAFGASLLASAGLAGLVVGVAARPTLSNLIAGLQIALTQPIRIDDVVIVEGEWGWVEEITTTFVVVRAWDQRRVVVPLSYFIERPFQNWTRRTADLIGTVFVYTDYTVPVEEVRAELHRILTSSGMWDGRVWGLQVTNTTERAVELRALLSAPDSGTAWDLRCHVRERLIDFLRRRYPQSLPRMRAEVQGLPGQ